MTTFQILESCCCLFCMFVFIRVKKYFVNQQPTSTVSHNLWPQVGKQPAGTILRQIRSTVTEEYYWRLLYGELLFMNIVSTAMIAGIGDN